MQTQFYIADEKLHKIGENSQLQALFEIAEFGAVFEDDGETGYFYLLDENGIIDALHIYNVSDIQNRDIPLEIAILSDEKCTIFMLSIMGNIHAIFDTNKKFWKNLNNFPECHSDWSVDKNRELTDEIIVQYIQNPEK